MSKFISNILVLATAVCAALYLYEHRLVAREKARTAELGKSLAESSLALSNALAANAEMAEKIDKANAALDRLRAQRAQASTATGIATNLQGVVDQIREAVQASGTTNRPSDPRAEFMKALGGMLNTSEAREFMRGQAQTQFDQVYASLLKELNLNDQDAEWFKSLVIERQMAAASSVFSMMGVQSEEEKKAAAAAQAKNQTAIDEKLSELLGPRGFAQYQDYQRTEEERATISQFKERLAPEDALDSKQEQDLTTAMYEERKAVRGDDDANRFAMKEGESMGEAFTRSMTQQREIRTRTAERAKTILTPKQLETFQSTQTPRWGRGGGRFQMRPQGEQPKQ